MIKKVTINPLDQSEINEASKLMLKVIKESPYYTAEEKRKEAEHHSAENLRKRLGGKEYIIRTAKIKGKIIGIVEGRHVLGTDFCWIEWILVKESHRGRGIASLLMQSIEEDNKGRYTRVVARTRVNNPSAKMFERRGYKKIKTLVRKVKMRNAYDWELKLD